MSRLAPIPVPLALALAAVLAGSGRGQTPEWSDDFHLPGVDRGPNGAQAVVYSAVAGDDGNGDALFVGGSFATAGATYVALGVARWDGTNWSSLGVFGVSGGRVEALAFYDDGAGSALYVAGRFSLAGNLPATNIAKWDGNGWSEPANGIGTQFVGDTVEALAVFDDGSGPALYAGGSFLSASGGLVPAANVARWDGVRWSPVGAGLPHRVLAFAVFDDGSGPALHAVSGAAGGRVYRWDGSVWTPIGPSGAGEAIHALAVLDEGAGPRLFAGGEFSQIGGVAANRIARWDGATWSPVGTGVPATVQALLAHDDGSGSGPALHAALDSPGNPGVSRWDGATWTTVSGAPDSAFALATFDDGGGPSLCVGGRFTFVDGLIASGVVSWRGGSWSGLGSGQGATDDVLALEVLDLGDGPMLYAGGRFEGIGGIRASKVARFDGATWSALGNGPQIDVRAVAAFTPPTGPPELWVGGQGLLRWDGGAWSPVPGITVDGTVRCMEVFTDQSSTKLYVGGEVTIQATGTSLNLARWNGSTWSDVIGDVNGPVDAMVVYDDGNNNALYVAGDFTSVGNVFPVTALKVARWRGTNWTAVGGGIPHGGRVRALGVFDDGSGPRLYAGGQFDFFANLASWDGSLWTTVGGGAQAAVRALHAYDVGDGERLYVGGLFSSVGSGAGTLAADGIASWNGAAWSTLGRAHDTLALHGFEGSGTTGLLAGGQLDSVGVSPFIASKRIGRWGLEACSGDPAVYCTGETNSLGCTSSLSTAGMPSATSTGPFSLVAHDVIPGEAGFLIYGFAKANLAFHGGRLCVKAPFERWLPPKAANGSGPPPCTGVLARDFNNRIQSGADPQLTAGRTVFAQWYVRDPADPGGNLENLTDAVRFVICP